MYWIAFRTESTGGTSWGDFNDSGQNNIAIGKVLLSSMTVGMFWMLHWMVPLSYIFMLWFSFLSCVLQVNNTERKIADVLEDEGGAMLSDSDAEGEHQTNEGTACVHWHAVLFTPSENDVPCAFMYIVQLMVALQPSNATKVFEKLLSYLQCIDVQLM